MTHTLTYIPARVHVWQQVHVQRRQTAFYIHRLWNARPALFLWQVHHCIHGNPQGPAVSTHKLCVSTHQLCDITHMCVCDKEYRKLAFLLCIVLSAIVAIPRVLQSYT